MWYYKTVNCVKYETFTGVWCHTIYVRCNDITIYEKANSTDLTWNMLQEQSVCCNR